MFSEEQLQKSSFRSAEPKKPTAKIRRKYIFTYEVDVKCVYGLCVCLSISPNSRKFGPIPTKSSTDLKDLVRK